MKHKLYIISLISIILVSLYYYYLQISGREGNKKLDIPLLLPKSTSTICPSWKPNLNSDGQCSAE